MPGHLQEAGVLGTCVPTKQVQSLVEQAAVGRRWDAPAQSVGKVLGHFGITPDCTPMPRAVRIK